MLVDATTADDAAVYQLDEHRALVVTVDYFTPIVDDPYDFGRIAAANALSDVYAMGARPLFALNLVGFPRDLLNEGVLGEIVRGGGEAAREAGIPILGGHSLEDKEPKFGMCVVGEAAPNAIVRNSTARAGDRLVLTKPIGTGVIATAIKNEAASEEVIEAAVRSMTTLNRGAAEAMLRAGATAATDVTGFGLLGHLRELARASQLAGQVSASVVPLLPGAAELAGRKLVPGGTRRNFADVQDSVEWAEAVTETSRTLLCDAQTSGGLLIAVAPDQVEDLLQHLRAAQTPAATVIGKLTKGPPGHIVVNP